MKMPGQNPDSLSLLRGAILRLSIDAEQKKMFGHETYFLRGFMFAGVFGDDLFVHVGEARAREIEIDARGIGFFEPMGKRMKAYITLNAEVQKSQLDSWLKEGAAFISRLPPKSPKVSAKKKASAAKKGTKKSATPGKKAGPKRKLKA